MQKRTLDDCNCYFILMIVIMIIFMSPLSKGRHIDFVDFLILFIRVFRFHWKTLLLFYDFFAFLWFFFFFWHFWSVISQKYSTVLHQTFMTYELYSCYRLNFQVMTSLPVINIDQFINF